MCIFGRAIFIPFLLLCLFLYFDTRGIFYHDALLFLENIDLFGNAAREFFFRIMAQNRNIILNVTVQYSMYHLMFDVSYDGHVQCIYVCDLCITKLGKVFQERWLYLACYMYIDIPLLLLL